MTLKRKGKVRGELSWIFLVDTCLILYYCRNWNTKKFWLACCSWFSHSSQPATSSSGWDLWWQSESFTCRGNYCNWIFSANETTISFSESRHDCFFPFKYFKHYIVSQCVLCLRVLALQHEGFYSQLRADCLAGAKLLKSFPFLFKHSFLCAWHSSIQRWGIVCWGLSSKILFLGSIIKLNSSMTLS